MSWMDEKEAGDLVSITGLTSYTGYEKVLFEAGMMQGQEWERDEDRDAEILRGGHGEMKGKVIAVWTGADTGAFEGEDIRLRVHPFWAEAVEKEIRKMQKKIGPNSVQCL